MSKRKTRLVLIPIFTSIAVVYFLMFWSIRKSPKDYTQIQKAGTLRIVTDYNLAGYFVSGDTIAGFNHDLIPLLSL